MLVCNYASGANYDGDLYLPGQACSDCPLGTQCDQTFPALCTDLWILSIIINKYSLTFIVTFIHTLLMRACGVPAVGVLAVDCWQWGSGHYNHSSSPSFFPPIFSIFFFSVATFSHRRSAQIKKLIQWKLLRTQKKLGVDTFTDPVRHFGAPWRPFWILQAVRRCGVAGG